jgi:L-amino acid N-acyltransferase YncA
MAATFHTRPARHGDIGAITEIYRHYVLTHTATFEIEPPDEAEMWTRMQKIVAGGLPYLAAERGDKLVGYCYATPYRPRAAYRHTIEDSVYVAPDSVGLGVGRTLLHEALAACRASGHREVIAIIGDSANTPSIALHQRAGFVHVGTLVNVGFKFNRWLDTVIMQKTLAT